MNARNARMIRESNVSESSLAVVVGATLVVLLVASATPPATSPIQVASLPVAANAAEGNVVDLTY
jgi:hypothetical protein